MAAAKIAITMDKKLLENLDLMVSQGKHANRSQAIQAAIREAVGRWRRTRLKEELAKIDPEEEQALANEVYKADTWPD